MSSARFCCIYFALVALAGARARPSPIKTIALSPVQAPDGLEDPAPASALFDSLLAAELGQAGLTVIPSRETGAIWQHFVDSVQGYYSALTGELVQAKYAAVRTNTLRALRDRFRADAWLRPTIQVVSVRFAGGEAIWDGASEGMGGGSSGATVALSLVVTVSDTAGTDIYIGRGGIQALSKGSNVVDRSKLFRDRKRNLQAVHLAIDSLLARAGRT